MSRRVTKSTSPSRPLTVGKALRALSKPKSRGRPKSQKVKLSWSQRQQLRTMNKLKNQSTNLGIQKQILTKKLDNIRLKRDFNEALTDMNASRGGPIGAYNRRKREKRAKSDMKIEMYRQEPNLSAGERKTKMQTDASVKKWNAAGRAVAVAGSAIATGYARGKKYDSEAEIAKADAEGKSADALRDSFNVLRQPEKTGGESTSGLIDGVR